MTERNTEASGLAYEIGGLLRAALCARDTVVNVEKLWNGDDGITQVLEVAERLMSDLIDKVETLERGAGKVEAV